MKNIGNEVLAISNWLKKQCDDSHSKGFVIGLSGGVDSTAACGLAAQAVGKERVLGVLLPSHTGFGNDVNDGRRVAEHFGISCIKIDIEKPVEYSLQALEHTDLGLPIYCPLTRVALGNIQARTRMMMLRTCAEMNKYLVLGTTNKSEDFIGYFTKGGDGGSGVDVEPMAQYYKSEIKEIVQHYGLPEDLVNRTPSAGLWEGQTDEGELGFTYDDIEKYCRYLDTFRDTGRPLTEEKMLEDLPIPLETADKIGNMHTATQHKRVVPPCYQRLT